MDEAQAMNALLGKLCWKWKGLVVVLIKKDQRATTLMVDLTKECARVSPPVVWAWATHFQLSSRILRVLRGYFEHWTRVRFKDV